MNKLTEELSRVSDSDPDPVFKFLWIRFQYPDPDFGQKSVQKVIRKKERKKEKKQLWLRTMKR